MGTRHLICVHDNGEYKVAQYGQWDGYPEGQGIDVLNFLSQNDLNLFRQKLNAVRFLGERDKAFLEEYDKNAPKWLNDPDNRTSEQKRWFKTYITRDLGSDILTNIFNSEDKEILLKNSLNFSQDSVFCEWAYVIDFDKGAFEIYKGFNKEPLGPADRFYFNGQKDEDDSDYYPVVLVKSYLLNQLPSGEDFLKDFTKPEEDNE